MSVRWFGTKISDQTVPVAYYCGIKERDELPGPFGGKFDGYMICIDIIDETDRPMAKHFSLPDHSMEDLSIMVIEKIYRKDTDHRRRKESHWIEMILSLTPDGLNLNP